MQELIGSYKEKLLQSDVVSEFNDTLLGIDSLCDGYSHAKLGLVYSLRLDCARVSGNSEAQLLLQKHVSFLKRLEKAKLDINYKLLIEGGSAAKREILECVNDKVRDSSNIFCFLFFFVSLSHLIITITPSPH